MKRIEKHIELLDQILTNVKVQENKVSRLKGNISKLSKIKPAKFKKDMLTKKSGKIVEIHNKKINSLARISGCPSAKSSGVYIHHHLKEKIKKGGKILTIYSESKSRLNQAVKYYREKKPIVVR